MRHILLPRFIRFLRKRPITYSLIGFTIIGTASSQSDYFPHQLKQSLFGYLRFLRSLRIGITISADYSVTLFGLEKGCEEYELRIHKVHQRSAERILRGCLQNGGLYIKLGQGLCALNHILPQEYFETLTQLHDKCLTREPDELTRLFLQDIGQEPTEVFTEFNETPIAAASVAQVFRAKTKDGEDVAVKVQYIDLRDRFDADITTIKILLKIIAFMHRDFNFSWVLDTLYENLVQELDFMNEGKNAERCARDLSHLSFVYVPKVYWNLTSKRILTTEFINDAFEVNDVEALRKNQFSLKDIDIKLFRAFGEQIFHTGFIHGDPHPGNVLVRKYKGETQIVLLDHGLYQKLEDEYRIALCQFWKSIILKDERKMKMYANKLGVDDYKIFAEMITQRPFQCDSFGWPTYLSEADLKYMTEQAQSRFNSIMRILQTMPMSLILVIRNLNTVRSIARIHHDPLNRYVEMAKIATKGTFKSNMPSKNVIAYFKSIISQIEFNFLLWYSVFKMTLLTWQLKIINIFLRSKDLEAISAQLA